MRMSIRPGDIGQRNTSARQAAGPGSLDEAFGDNGLVVQPAKGLGLPAGDGKKYWTVAMTERPGRLEIRRLLNDGTPDPSFPLTGTIVDLYPGAADFDLWVIRLQSAGKIVLGGRLYLADGTTTALIARLGTDGLIDRSFGDDGVRVIDFEDEAEERWFYAMEVQADGKIVATTTAIVEGKTLPRVVRLDSAGKQDASFGSNGVLYELPVGWILTCATMPRGGGILFGGMSLDVDVRAVLLRLKDDGRPETAFGNQGVVLLDDHPGIRVFDLAIAEPSGSIVAGGIFVDTAVRGWMVRLLPDGKPDRKFNRGLVRALPEERVYRLAMQKDGKTLFHGVAVRSNASRLMIGRLDIYGSLDPTFGEGGLAVPAFPVESPYANSYSHAQIQGDKLFVSDTVNCGDDRLCIQLVRFLLA